MVLTLYNTVRPGPGTPGPGRFAWLRCVPSGIATAIVLSFPAVLAGAVVFAGLQATRVQFWQQCRVEQQRGTGTHPDPETLARFGGWFYRAGNLTAQSNYTGPFPEAASRMVDENRVFVAGGLAVALSAAAVAVLVMVATLSIVLKRSRRVPFEFGFAERLAICIAAVRVNRVWSIASAILSSGVVWYLAFDRDGVSRPLVEGIVPTVRQAACMVGAWSVLIGVAAWNRLPAQVAMLGRATLSDRRVCARCRYPTRGLAAGVCPECGWEIAGGEVSVHSPRRQGTRRARVWGLAACGVVVVAVLVTVSRSGPFVDWMMLRPSDTPWAFTPGANVVGRTPLCVRSIYGRVCLQLKQAATTENAATTARCVEWTLEPGPNATKMPTAGVIRVEPIPDQAWGRSQTKVHTPLGPLWFWTDASGSDLFVGLPSAIFRP